MGIQQKQPFFGVWGCFLIPFPCCLKPSALRPPVKTAMLGRERVNRCNGVVLFFLFLLLCQSESEIKTTSAASSLGPGLIPVNFSVFQPAGSPSLGAT